ncbi:MAG: cation transporter [Spirochaetia bacterium]|nr:cation transporter [Spirochaetia bacterium]MBP5739963.1 cation transporter [Spirochaetia bacterium]
MNHTDYGKRASIIGICCNVLLCLGKLAAGYISGSISIVADGLNNLSDASGNAISFLGFKLGERKPDAEHPYGHARYEYVAGLVVSVIILSLGFSLTKEAVLEIINPDPPTFSWLSIIILVISIAVKLWMSLYSRKVGEKIGSDTLKAVAIDSRNDVIATSAVLAGIIFTYFSNLKRLDGILGLAVALFIIYSGIELVREMLSPLLGESPDPELVRSIEEKVLSYPNVLGIHDLMVHDYGPGHTFASLHVEMPAEMDVMESHDLIDCIENDLTAEGVQTSIHFDPIVTEDSRVADMRLAIAGKVKELDSSLTIHDLRLVIGPTHTNVLFDLVFPAGFKGDTSFVVKEVEAFIKSLNSKNIPKIKVEQGYTR